MNTSAYRIRVHNRQSAIPIDPPQLNAAVQTVLRGEHIPQAEVNIAVVDNQQIHDLNRQFLNHDFPTDVISFSLGEEGEPLEGDLMVSVEMARETAARYHWSESCELLLYVIHGTLHLVGYDDTDDPSRQAMRMRELYYLRALGITRPTIEPVAEQSTDDAQVSVTKFNDRNASA